MSTAPSQRGRATPEQSRNEILDAAQEALWELPVAKLTVGGLMAHTRLGRSSFYVHFADIGALVAALLERLEGELWEAAKAWTHTAVEGEAALDAAIDGVVDVWVRHGPVLRAIIEAGATDAEVAKLWREGVVERFAKVIAERLPQQPDATDHAVVDHHELATALLLMNERYLMDRLGRTPQADPQIVSVVLRTIWKRALGT